MIQVFDDVLADPMAYRQAALRETFRSLEFGPVTFHGIALPPSGELLAWLFAHDPARRPTLSFLRKSPSGQHEPNYRHTDVDMGQWTGILYLNPDPPDGDGTTFWRATQPDARWTDDAWDVEQTVDAKFNRLLLFSAEHVHSRSIFDNYGDTPDTSRLIQVVFGV